MTSSETLACGEITGPRAPDHLKWKQNTILFVAAARSVLLGCNTGGRKNCQIELPAYMAPQSLLQQHVGVRHMGHMTGTFLIQTAQILSGTV
jgi:hypothetical protein